MMLCLLVIATAIDLPAVHFQDLRRESAVLKKELMAALEPTGVLRRSQVHLCDTHRCQGECYTSFRSPSLVCCASIHEVMHGRHLAPLLPLALRPYANPIWIERRPVEFMDAWAKHICFRSPLVDFDYGGIIQLSLWLCRSTPTPLLLRIDRVPGHRPFFVPVEPVEKRHISSIKREVVKLRVCLYAGRRRRLR